MNWTVKLLPEAVRDMEQLDGSQRLLVRKAIRKVSANPLPMSEGGYGKPLGNHSDTRLAGMLKIKLRDAGLRIVYRIVRTESEMIVIIIGARADDMVYRDAQARAEKHRL